MCDKAERLAKENNRCSQCTSDSEDTIKDQLMGCAESIRVGTNFGHDAHDHQKICMPLSKFLENIMDMSLTIIEILIICGVHECKARRTNDLIISSFIYFDEIPSRTSKKFKKKLKKDSFFSALATEVPMSGSDALLTYAITKYAFKAFYYKQTVKYYDPGFVSECQWSKAVKKMFQAFVRLNRGSSCKHIQRSECLIKSTIEEYIDRVRRRGRKMTIVAAGEDGGMSQIGARPRRQSITACPICESMKKCNENSATPHKPCDIDKWIAWLHSSPEPFAKSAYNPSCQSNKVISGAELKNACYSCLEKCNACDKQQSSKGDCLNGPCKACGKDPQPNCSQASSPCDKCGQSSSPCDKCGQSSSPCNKCGQSSSPCNKCGQSSSPCNKCGQSSSPCDKCGQSSSPCNKCGQSSSPCNKCQQQPNPCSKCHQPEKENCYPRSMPCCEPSKPCKLSGCNQQQQSQRSSPCGNKNNNETTYVTGKNQSCASERNQGPCGPKCGPPKPMNPCPKCDTSNKPDTCDSLDILWQSQPSPCPNIKPCSCNNLRNCAMALNKNKNCSNKLNCGGPPEPKCIPCISAYPKTCQEVYKPKKIHEIKCCLKKLPNKRCPCGTKGASKR